MKDLEFIHRILIYTMKIQDIIQSVVTLEEFKNDTMAVDAISFNLEQIGETAKKISLQTRKLFCDIPWKSIIGLRNQISHDYEGINLKIIYDISINDIPLLQQKLSINNSSFD